MSPADFTANGGSIENNRGRVLNGGWLGYGSLGGRSGLMRVPFFLCLVLEEATRYKMIMSPNPFILLRVGSF